MVFLWYFLCLILKLALPTDLWSCRSACSVCLPLLAIFSARHFLFPLGSTILGLWVGKVWRSPSYQHGLHLLGSFLHPSVIQWPRCFCIWWLNFYNWTSASPSHHHHCIPTAAFLLQFLHFSFAIGDLGGTTSSIPQVQYDHSGIQNLASQRNPHGPSTESVLANLTSSATTNTGNNFPLVCGIYDRFPIKVPSFMIYGLIISLTFFVYLRFASIRMIFHNSTVLALQAMFTPANPVRQVVAEVLHNIQWEMGSVAVTNL